MSYRATAHGKCILIGEHSVVHGTDAIALPVGQSLSVELGERPADGLPEPFIRWFGNLSKQHSGQRLYPQSVQGDLPAGSGLGSSAALGVAALRALAQLVPISDTRLLELADSSEQLFHGNPSGVDVRAVLSQTPIVFRKSTVANTPPQIQPLPTPPQSLTFWLWITPQGDSTATVVARVADSLNKSGEPEVWIRRAADCIATAKAALTSGDAVALGRAMSEFQAWLACHGASTAFIDDLAEQAIAAGALGAKLTGGGGGGAMLVLAPDADWTGPDLPQNVNDYRFELG